MLIVASNSTGGVMGKMIDAQSIVVAAVATEQSGGEGQILRFVFLHSLVLACLVGLLTLAAGLRVPVDDPGRLRFGGLETWRFGDWQVGPVGSEFSTRC